eukprot:scaffold2908_cov257-Pinguiococcus_pyrenoidosus.AAC.29
MWRKAPNACEKSLFASRRPASVSRSQITAKVEAVPAMLKRIAARSNFRLAKDTESAGLNASCHRKFTRATLSLIGK